MVTQEMAGYEPTVIEVMRGFYQSLSEKDRRRYAAVEAMRVGHGGIRLVAEVLGCSEHTIERGMPELTKLPEDPVSGRVRRPGGGRKKNSNRAGVGAQSPRGDRATHGG